MEAMQALLQAWPCMRTLRSPPDMAGMTPDQISKLALHVTVTNIKSNVEQFRY